METHQSDTTVIKTTCGKLYITITYNEHGMHHNVFITMGKAGNCSNCHFQAVARMITRCFELGDSYMKVAEQLKGLRCPEFFYDKGQKFSSCYDAIATLFEEKRISCDKLQEEKDD